jgi:hypothetical protein
MSLEDRIIDPSARESTISTIKESTAGNSQPTHIAQDIKHHTSKENVDLIQTCLDHILLQAKILALDKQSHQQELANKDAEIKRQDDTITTLSKEISFKDIIISNLQNQIVEIDAIALEKNSTNITANNIITTKEDRILRPKSREKMTLSSKSSRTWQRSTWATQERIA